MAKLLEYQCKKALAGAGIRVPRGVLVKSPEEAAEAAARIGGPVVLKAQLPFTGRMGVGAVKFASSPEEARSVAGELFSKTFRGFKPNSILVEEKIDIARELYLGIIVNDSYRVKGPTTIFSSIGGPELEEIAVKNPEAIVRIDVDYLEGPNASVLAEAIKRTGVEGWVAERVASLAVVFYEKIFKGLDAMAAEMNPLALTRSGELVALDCRVTVDDSALYRHQDLELVGSKGLDRDLTPLEERIWRWEEVDTRGTGYFIQLATDTEKGGYIGFHGIGGGGAMLGADALTRAGLKIANYADTSGDPPASKVYRVVKTILSQPGIEGYALLGPVMASQEQWHHAHAIVKALREMLRDKPGFPVLILLAGNKEEESHEILRRGLKDLPIRLEIYGRERLYDLDFIANRMKEMVEEYRRERSVGAGAR